MPIQGMTPEEIKAATANVVMAGGKSTDPSNRLPGETATEANARITAAYKDMTAKPVLSAEQAAAGAKVQYVRTGAGGFGEYTVTVPPGYQGEKITRDWTSGIIPTGSKYTTGESVGKYGTATSGVDKTVSTTAKNPDGSTTVTFTDGTTTIVPASSKAPTVGSVINTSASTNGNTGSTGSANLVTGSGTTTATSADVQARQSAYDLLYNEFNKYGLGTLVEGIKDLIKSNVSPSQFSIALQNTDAYKQRFAANQDRIKAGLRALTPAEYIGLEDQYQNIMRNYGLPASYWSKDSMGTQAGFNKFIANDVSAAELEDRIATAQKRVINADPAVTDALRQFYPDITNADILAYTLDPTNALENIKRKVTAAEIGGAALGQGLGTSVGRAEELAKYGITKAQAQQGYSTIGEFLPTAEKLGDIYAKQGLGDYNQAVAEAEVFNTANAADAARKRKKLTQLEQATFGGQAGTSQGALARDRAGSI